MIKTKRLSLAVAALVLGALPLSSMAVKWQGELTVMMADDFKHNTSQTLYELSDNNSTYSLNVPTTIKMDGAQTGDLVSVEGYQSVAKKKQSVINVQQFTLIKRHQGAARAAITGARNALVLMLNFSDYKATDRLTTTSMANKMYFNDNSIRQNYLDSSFS